MTGYPDSQHGFQTMKRLFLYLILGLLTIVAIRAMHHRHPRPVPAENWQYAGHRHGRPAGPGAGAEARRQAEQAVAEARRAMHEAGREFHEAWREARDEMSRAYREARDEMRQAYREVRDELAGREESSSVLPPPPPPPAPLPTAVAAGEEAEGLPVRIVPGTRVTEAEIRPPVPARPAVLAVANSSAAGTQTHREVTGQVCVTQDRARAEALSALRTKVVQWLEPDVPSGGPEWTMELDGRRYRSNQTRWTPPDRLLVSMIVKTTIEPYVSPTFKEEGPFYRAKLTADFSPRHRAELVDAYNRDLVRHRLFTLGGSLGFVLICLAAISGYIRADEATRGYYTNRLRLLAAAGVGAAGVIVYRLVA